MEWIQCRISLGFRSKQICTQTHAHVGILIVSKRIFLKREEKYVTTSMKLQVFLLFCPLWFISLNASHFASFSVFSWSKNSIFAALTVNFFFKLYLLLIVRQCEIHLLNLNYLAKKYSLILVKIIHENQRRLWYNIVLAPLPFVFSFFPFAPVVRGQFLFFSRSMLLVSDFSLHGLP